MRFGMHRPVAGIGLQDAGHISFRVGPVKYDNDPHLPPRLESIDQGIPSLGVDSSFRSRVVNQSASPVGMMIAIKRSSFRGSRAFLGAGSEAGRPEHCA